MIRKTKPADQENKNRLSGKQNLGDQENKTWCAGKQNQVCKKTKLGVQENKIWRAEKQNLARRIGNKTWCAGKLNQVTVILVFAMTLALEFTRSAIYRAGIYSRCNLLALEFTHSKFYSR